MTDAIREKAIEAAALASANEQRRDVGLPPLEVLGTDMTSELVRRYTRVAIDACEAAMWQTMDSALRDGTRFLAQWDDGFVMSADVDCLGFSCLRRWRPMPLPPEDKP
jgi:hypothetical protein